LENAKKNILINDLDPGLEIRKAYPGSGPGVKKIPDPGSGSAELVESNKLEKS
jgi:hypothetical protein